MSPEQLSVQTMTLFSNTDTSNHIKFLAEISFQLSNPTILLHALQLPQLVLDRIKHECQQIGDLSLSSCIYKLLVKWVIRNGRDARLSNLKSALYRMGFKILCGSTSEDPDVLVRPCFDEHPFPTICSSVIVSSVGGEVKFVFDLSRMLRCCWRSVGSLMGIPLVRLTEIDIKAVSSDISPEYTMLSEWQKRNGRDATLGTMFKAIKCVFDYSPYYINHAYWYATQFAQRNIQQ